MKNKKERIISFISIHPKIEMRNLIICYLKHKFEDADIRGIFGKDSDQDIIFSVRGKNFIEIVKILRSEIEQIPGILSTKTYIGNIVSEGVLSKEISYVNYMLLQIERRKVTDILLNTTIKELQKINEVIEISDLGNRIMIITKLNPDNISESISINSKIISIFEEQNIKIINWSEINHPGYCP